MDGVYSNVFICTHLYSSVGFVCARGYAHDPPCKKLFLICMYVDAWICIFVHVCIQKKICELPFRLVIRSQLLRYVSTIDSRMPRY